jgi:glycosyltransferase involved in cell wall biosynthesis
MRHKPTILILLKYYLPGYKSGGPVRSIEGLTEHFSDSHEFRVVAYDRDYDDQEPYPGVTVGEWQPIGKAEVTYLPVRRARWLAMFRILRKESYDLLYLQSLFNPCFTLWPLILRRIGLISNIPILLAPRGELSDGALNFKSSKKHRFLSAARTLGLFNGIHWQASSEWEAVEIRASGLVRGGEVHIARNLRIIPPARLQMANYAVDPSAPLRLVFVSRIAPKKNLDTALRCLQKVTVPVRFDIHGPIDRDKNHWVLCRGLMDALPANVEAIYHGPAEPSVIPEIFARADAFLFPTRGENFGHVIAEALLAGCPVLTSDRTPWNGLEALGCGVNLAPDDDAGFARAIEKLAAMQQQARKSTRNTARQCGLDGLGIEKSIEAHKRMIAAILGKSEGCGSA